VLWYAVYPDMSGRSAPMRDGGMRTMLAWLGILVVVAVVGVAVYAALRPSPQSLPGPLAAEFRELSATVAGKALPDARSLTQAQLDEMLYSSAGHGSPGIVAWLLLQGANPRANQKDLGANYADRSALREAARQRRCESEKLLVGRIAELAGSSAVGTREQKAAAVAEQVASFVNQRDPHSIGPLHDAVEGGARDCVAVLLKAGARVDASDENGMNALALARQKQRDDLVPMLSAAL